MTPVKLVTVTLHWTPTTPSSRHEFEAHENGNVWRAYRNRSGYGWSYWTVTVDNQPAPSYLDGRVELPRSFSDWR